MWHALFKSHWYYWYTGNKRIAVTSVMVSTVIMWLMFVLCSGFSIWGIIIAVVLDVHSLLLVLIYFVALRAHIPDYSHFLETADAFIVKQFLFPIVVAFFVTRLSTFGVAKLFSHDFFFMKLNRE